MFFWNRQPLRGGSVEDEFADACHEQWLHMTFDGKYAQDVHGLDFRGNMVPDATGVIERPGTVWMWGLGTATVIGVERA